MKPLDDREKAFARLKEITDLLYGLRSNLAEFPANEYVIRDLLNQRSKIMKEYIHSVGPYP